MALLNLGGGPKDAQDGAVTDNPVRMGNRTYGQRMFLSGTERPIDTGVAIYDWYAFETLTVSTTALALTESLSELAEQVFITVEAQAVRYRLDGQSPTASVGHILTDGDVLELHGRFEIDKFRVIRKDGTDATVRASFGVRRFDG